MSVEVEYKETEGEVFTHGPAVIEFPEPNMTNHRWKQHGIMVECDSCTYAHGFAVDVNQQLTGIDASGYPTFKSLSI